MVVLRALLGAALAAAGLAAPAAAQPTAPGQDLVYTVTATHPEGAGRLSATCVFRPDRWTADYGPTYVDAVASTSGVAQHTWVTCRVYTWGSLSGEVTAESPASVVAVSGERTGTIGYRPNVTVCVEAGTQYVVDIGFHVSRCVTP